VIVFRVLGVRVELTWDLVPRDFKRPVLLGTEQRLSNSRGQLRPVAATRGHENSAPSLPKWLPVSHVARVLCGIVGAESRSWT
jgi:hypothetical protein